ncbi:MAG TPA: lactonase family protein [Cyclobacteriaceae bacterium]|nr:lactonase family protein [Cyclobacteriaceae bacterium]
MLKTFIYSILGLISFSQLSDAQNREFIYVGTFSGDSNQGLFVYEFNRAQGTLRQVQVLGGMTSPTFIEIHPNGKYLYSLSRNSVNREESWGSVSSYAIDQASGNLTHINDQTSGGNAPVHMTIDSQGRMLFMANYGSGSIAAYPILADGSLSPASSFHQHTGSSISGERQQGPHAHCAVISPDDQYLYAADLGIDKIKTYRVDYATNELVPIPASDGVIEPGSGPRHIAISTNMKFAYLLEEMGWHITVLAINKKTGGLNQIQRISTLPEGFNGTNFCADIHIDPTGEFLYASNRGHNSLAIFKIDKKSGKLSLIEIFKVPGDWPRNFLIDLRGNYLFVANQNSSNLVILKRDPETGKLTDTGTEVRLPQPTCIKMLEVR